MSENKKIQYIKLDDEIAEPQNITPSVSGAPKKKKRRYKKNPALSAIAHVLGIIGTTFLSLIMIVVITVCIVATAFTVYIMQFANSSFEVDLKNVDLSYTSFIYAKDKDGNDVEIKRLSGEQNRIWVDMEQIPKHTQDAFVATEDKRFFEHQGVDWKRTIKVTISTLLSGYGEGGSTITQQLVKNITGDARITPERKIREIFRALTLETEYTKIDILESYLNRVPQGSTVYGVGSAAYHYFDKSVDQLTIAESAILAGLTSSPSTLNPYADLAESKRKQLYTLKNMYDQGLITTDEYEAAKVEKVKFRLMVKGDAYGYVDPRYEEQLGIESSTADGESSDIDDDGSEALYEDEDTYEAYRWNEYTISQNWYVDAAIDQAIEDIAAAKGYTYEEAHDDLYSGGYKVYLNMDMEIQERLEEYCRDPYHFMYSYDTAAFDEDLMQAAFIITDYRGNVIALAGGIGDKPGDSCFNRATMALLPIGSTMKPISLYGQAIDKNLITYSSMLYDRYITLPDGSNWPMNFEGDYGSGGYIPTWYAVQQSKNTVAVRVAELLGIDTCFSFLADDLHITSLDYTNDKAYSPIALGQLTDGMTLLELAGAYQIFGSGGKYYQPKLYSKITDYKDDIVLEQEPMGEKVMDSDSAYITNRLMKAVVDTPNGSGRLAKIDGVEVVGKTGTSNDERILAFAGLTPDYLGIVRIGYDDNKKVTGTNYIYCAQIWHDFMVTLINEESTKTFVRDTNVVEKDYCTKTGLLASSKCPSTAKGYYKSNVLPKMCDCEHNETEDNDPYYENHGGETLLVEDGIILPDNTSKPTNSH